MRKQRAFSALTEQEIEQLADRLRREPCETVLDGVNKPRPEGFGLNISKNPLQTFCAKVMLLDSIKLAPAPLAHCPLPIALACARSQKFSKILKKMHGGGGDPVEAWIASAPSSFSDPKIFSRLAFRPSHLPPPFPCIPSATSENTVRDTELYAVHERYTKSTRPVHEKPQQIHEIHEKNLGASCLA